MGRVALIITSQHFNLLCLLLDPPDWIAISTCISCIHSAAQTKSAQKAAEWSNSGAPLTPPGTGQTSSGSD